MEHLLSNPRYMNDFSKALAAEVRILLQEVGKLRDEKRALQFEVSELLAMKARHGADGEYHPEWRPPHEPPAAIAPPPEPEPPSQELVLHQEAKSGWRAVPKKHERKPREPRAPKVKMPEPPPPPPAPVPQANIPSWASWRPNPLYHPQPRQAAAPAPPPGLFGPPSPPPR
ncbi:hypothetical protein FRC19_010005 [Serendipita sp. 401]|nr:hypothetical protein FRC15_006804 [Serendipita sp. 397]KAG8802935.1 hypothetical protein FRC16_008265 [Serendipita sp. 398]KAG8826001.1 hypothetical protein FRC19_010005 [Serendipita sp. 401]